MFSPKHLLFISIIFVSSTHFSFSAPPDTQKYSLQKCIELGLLKNVQIIRSENAVITSKSRKTQAYGEFIPSINGSLSWSRADRDQYSIRNNELVESRDNYRGSLFTSLTLFDGLANIATVDQSIINQRIAQQNLARTRQDITYQIQAGFFNVLRMKQLLAAARENLTRSRKQLERIQELNRVGSIPLADVYRQQVQVGRDELSVINTENDEKNALADLAFLIGLSATEEFDIDESSVELQIDSVVMKDFRDEIKSYTDAVETAIRQRPDFASAREMVSSAQKGVVIARSGYFPSLNASASYGWSDIVLERFFPDRTKYDYFSYGLTLSIPILSNLRTRTAVEQAMVAKRDAEENLDQVERQISVEMKKALNQLETAEKNIEQAKRNLVAAREDLRIAEERYAVGAGTLLDQVTANANFITAQTDNVNALYNYLIARKQVEYYLGTANQ